MSHELRTPLNSIIGFANVLRKNRSTTMTDDQMSFANRIATNGLHLLALINDILDLSKIEAGRMTLDLSAVMLDTLVRETIDELEGEAKDRPVVVRAEIPDVIRSIGTDAARMKQVLINLIGNSLKFTEQGEVVVAIETDPLGVPQRISVRDTGIGIPEDRLDAIFNVFEQAESVTSRRFGGTGLGLAISRSLCELMGHRLDVESVEGVGTTMLIRLGTAPRTSRRSMPGGVPVIPEPTAIAPTIRAENPEAPLVLVVDEDEDTALLLGRMLEESGCRVAKADSGVDALRMARDLLPDMIFLDLRLPKISGFDVFRILKADDMLKDTPVVITSVAGSEARPGLAGAAAILDKPISRAQALELVRLWIPGTAH
jgi:CheY-like chemotaxis protein